MQESFAAEFYGCPTYFVTTARSEIVGFNVRVYHWEKRGNILAPQFIAIVPAQELAVISSEVRETAKKSLMLGWGDYMTASH